MTTRELIKKMTVMSLLKFIFVLSSAFYLPMTLLMSFLILLGVFPVTFNEIEYTGFLGFIFALIISLILVVIFTIGQWFILSLGMVIARIWIK